MTISSTLTFEHGDKTCAIVKGRFCRFFGAKRFGQQPWCLLFNTELWSDREDGFGWILRCEECKQLPEKEKE